MLQKLETLRGVAACLVVLYHSPFSYQEVPTNFIANSYLFVDFFFVLSGYVMSLAYSERIENGLPFRSYAIVRLGRIYPLHFFLLFVWVFYVGAKQYLQTLGFGGEAEFLDRNNFSSFVSNLLLLHSVGLHGSLNWNYPSWSISAEFIAYLFFFFFTVLADKKRRLLTAAIVSLAAYAILVSLGRPDIDISYDFGFLRCIAGFYAGVFVFRLKSKFEGTEIDTRWIGLVEAALAVALFFSVAMVDFHRLGFIAAILVFALCVYVFSGTASGTLGAFLERPAMGKLGLWSYSIYMLHAIIIAGVSNVSEFIIGFDPATPLGFYAIPINLSLLAATIFCSRFTYVYIEKKYRDLSRQFVKGGSTTKVQETLAVKEGRVDRSQEKSRTK